MRATPLLLLLAGCTLFDGSAMSARGDAPFALGPVRSALWMESGWSDPEEGEGEVEREGQRARVLRLAPEDQDEKHDSGRGGRGPEGRRAREERDRGECEDGGRGMGGVAHDQPGQAGE